MGAKLALQIDEWNRGHLGSPDPPVHGAPGSGVCGPIRNARTNSTMRGSSVDSARSWTPHAEATTADRRPGNGLTSMNVCLPASRRSVSTWAGGRSERYVIHTAPCSREWTAVSSGIGASYNPQFCQTGAWSPPTGGVCGLRVWPYHHRPRIAVCHPAPHRRWPWGPHTVMTMTPRPAISRLSRHE